MTPSAFGRAAAYALSLLALTACGGTSPDTATPLGVPTAVPSRPIAPALPLGATAVPTAPPAAIPTAVPSPIPAVDPTAAPASAQPATIQAPVRFAVMPDRSKATFRVREQLARLQFPSDAVGSTSKVTGAIVIAPDGTFDQSQSKVNVNVNDLRTDDQLRDGFIKRTTLETQRYPNAEFVPLRASGLPVPVPYTRSYRFQLIGLTTIH